MKSTKIKSLLKALLAICMVLFLAGFLAFTFRVQILTGLAQILVVDDNLQPADIIFVLTGDIHSRPFHASELFKQGFAPQIVLSKEQDYPAVKLGLFPNGSDVSIEVMKKLGVPEENITQLQVEGGATSTRDEAVILHRYIEEHNIKRVILVTTAFHTRRAKWIFEKELSGLPVTLEVSAAPQLRFDETNWWQHESGLITFANEYLKLFYYFAIY